MGDNPCLKCFKKIFSKMYPYYSVTTFTGWGHLMKNYLLFATILHSCFIVVSLALIGFEPMYYNMLLALLAYSCYLTLNNCTICCYITLLVFAIAGGLTWGIAYTGTGGVTSSCPTNSSDHTSKSANSTASASSHDDHNCGNNVSLNGGLSGT